jgi:hypothetical protein
MNPITITMYQLTIIALCVILAITIYYFNSKEPVDQSIPKDDAICADYSMETPSTLETGVINEMVKEYRTKQLVAINAIMVTPDTYGDAHSVWFDLKTLKKFIFHIEHNVRINDPSNTDELGMRLYYAAYPSKTVMNDKTDLHDVADDYEFRHTVVMIPTIYNSTVGNVDFNPMDNSTYEGYISQEKELNSDIRPYQAANYTPMALSNTERVVSRNHGSLIPPAPPIVEAF